MIGNPDYSAGYVKPRGYLTEEHNDGTVVKFLYNQISSFAISSAVVPYAVIQHSLNEIQINLYLYWLKPSTVAAEISRGDQTH